MPAGGVPDAHARIGDPSPLMTTRQTQPLTPNLFILRGQRGEGTVSQNFAAVAGQPLRLGREPRLPPSHPAFDPEYGSDLVFPGDDHVSNFHATLTWDRGRVRVQRRPGARNPILVYDRDRPGDPPRPADEFEIEPFDRFAIGNTVFTLLPDDGPIERVRSGAELRAMTFADPAPRIEALAALPEVIQLAPNEEQLASELLDVLLRGVPRATVAAVVELPADGPADDTAEVAVRAVRWRAESSPGFRPSRQLVVRALRWYENTCHIWTGGAGDGNGAGGPTRAVNLDWALCVRLVGPRDEGLYVAGKLPPGQFFSKARGGSAALDGDMKFAKLAGDIFTGLRELRQLQQREAFLTQLVAPVVRNYLRGKPLEEVTAPRELPVTVLFCDLRGFTASVHQGQADLMGTWDKLSQALDVMVEAIVEHEGVIGDFQGDAAMGFWGWPLPQDDQVERAARAALAIRRKFVALGRHRRDAGAGFACGIGIAQGPAIAGKLGASDQAKIGVFGPAVNRAARLEAATKALRVPILVDEAVAAALAAGHPWCRVRRVARVIPQGLPEPVPIGELLPPEGEPGPNLSETTRRLYEASLDRFQAGDWAGFRRMVGSLPQDGPAEFLTRFIERSQGPSGQPPDGWNGGVPVAK